MGLVLFIFGAAFGLVFILNNILRTVRRQREIRFFEITLAFMVTLIPVAALLVDNRGSARFDLLEQIMFLLIIPLLISSIGLTVIELFRPRGLRQSRGLLGLGIALLLLLANLSFNVISLTLELSSTAVLIRPTPVNATPDFSDPCDTDQLAGDISQSFLRTIAVAADVSVEELLAAFAEDGNLSAASLVRENGGDPRVLIDDISQDVDSFLIELVGAGCIPPLARPLVLSQINPFIEQAINDDFNTLLTGFSGGFGPGGPQAAPEDNSFTEADLQATRVALITALPTEDLRPTATPSPSPTATLTRTPTVTRTPLPTNSATPTRERFVTATPSPSPTLPNPCLATANFNLNMRDLPNLDESEVLITIPFDESFAVYGPNDDQTWWFGQYEDAAGWVLGEYITLTRPCFELPPRR